MRRRLPLGPAAFAASVLLLTLGAAPGAAAKDAPKPPPPPPIAGDLKAAMIEADAGSPAALVKLADGGRADAQFFLGAAYLAARHGSPRDPAKGCAYAQMAASARGDAAFLAGRCAQDGLAGP